jgi:hypothetical protein
MPAPLSAGRVSSSGRWVGRPEPVSASTSREAVPSGDSPVPASSHWLALFPVEEGRGPEDVLEYIEENPELDGPPPPWVIGEGTGTFAKPGKTADPVSTKLEPGTYLAVCFVSTKQSEGTPHAALGMISEITVG